MKKTLITLCIIAFMSLILVFTSCAPKEVVNEEVETVIDTTEVVIQDNLSVEQIEAVDTTEKK